MLNYRKPEWWVVAVALVTVVAVVIGLAVNPRTGDKGLAATLLQYRTEYVGDAPKVGGIVTTLEYPANAEYSHFGLQTDTPPYSVTLYLNTDADTLRFYSEDTNQGPFLKNAVIMFSLIRNADSVMFMLDDGTKTHVMEFTRNMAESFMGGDLWAYSESQEQFGKFLETLDSIEISLPESDGEEGWKPQPKIEDQEAYRKALAEARQSVKVEEIGVDDMGNHRLTALVWMEAYFERYKALPEDNMADLAEATVDRLDLVRVSRAGQPKGFVFEVEFSVRPTYPISHNSFWMAENTYPSPSRGETWGQMYRQVELNLGEDGCYYCVEMGTGPIGLGKGYIEVPVLWNIEFHPKGQEETPEEAALTFARVVYPDYLLNLPVEAEHGITAYEMLDFLVKTSSENSVTAEITVAVRPVHEIYYIGLNTERGTGKHEGWLILKKNFTLEKTRQGYWRCIELGNVY